ncbi:MAG TPA: nitrilase-related carbon-nitrogen hydrolase [Gemmataceae bacterium]|jgi:hypothetical protein
MFDTQRSLQKLTDLTAEAAASGAELVVFPEAFIAGYPKGHDLGVRVGIRSPAGRSEFHQLFESPADFATNALLTGVDKPNGERSAGKSRPCRSRATGHPGFFPFADVPW